MRRAILISLFLLFSAHIVSSQAPSKLSKPDREANRQEALRLLARAAQTAAEIEDTGQRVTALTQIAVEQSRGGDKESAALNLVAAYQLMEAEQTKRPRTSSRKRTDLADAYARMGDLASAMRVVESTDWQAERDSLLATVVRSYGVAGRLVAAADVAEKIAHADAREQALFGLLRPVGPGRPSVDEIQNVAARLRTPSFQARAQSILGAAKIRAGDPTGGRDLADAAELAHSTSQDSEVRPNAGTSWLVGCRVDQRESEHDATLRHVADQRIQAGDIAGALSDVENITSAPGKETVLARIALAQIRAGDLAGAQQSASRIARVTCRDNALAGMALAHLRSGDLRAVLEIANGISSPRNKAEVFERLAHNWLVAKHPAEALRFANEALLAAGAIDHAELRGDSVARLAMIQAEAGALALAAETLRQYSAAVLKNSPPRDGWLPTELRRVLICQAGIGDSKSALAVLENARPIQRPSLILAMARRQANAGDPQGALSWVEALPIPTEKTFGLTGAAMGLLQPPSGYRNC